MSGWPDDLLRTAAKFGVELTDGAQAQFRLFLQELTAANRKMNLVSFSDEAELAIRHFADSLVCAGFLPQGRAGCIDVGSGAGLPGIPLKICLPKISMVLLDSVGKKTEFLKAVVKKLGLDDTVVLQMRAEDLGRDDTHRERYDTALSRAVVRFAVALEYTLPLVRVGGSVIIYQGPGVTEATLTEHERALQTLGGRVEHVEPYLLAPGGTERNVVVIKKVEHTPTDYPRRPGVPKKRPLV